MPPRLKSAISKLGRVVLQRQWRQLRFIASAWLAAPVVELSLAVVGFNNTLRWLEATSPTHRSSHPTPHPTPRPTPLGDDTERAVDLDQGRRLVAGVYRFHFVRGQCLPRALVQYWLHRRAGTPVRFVLGVQRSATDRQAPHLRAHAWVEEPEGRVDDGEFQPLFRSEFDRGATAG